MRMWIITIYFYVVFQLFHTVLCTSHAGPENVAVLVGNTLEFKFWTSSPFFVNWLDYSQSVTGQAIYLNGSNIYNGDSEKAARFETGLSSNGSHYLHTLVLKDVQFDDAGKYGAQEFLESYFRWAEAIVLGNDLICYWENTEPKSFEDQLLAGDVINITCGTVFRGKWPPFFNCTSPEFQNWTATNVSENGYAGMQFLAEVNPGTPFTSILCITWFHEPSTGEDTPGFAHNVPEYHSAWRSQTMTIFYPPTDITVTPDKLSYDVNDEVTCTATGGHPSPTYRWTKYDGNTTVFLPSTQNVKITPDLAGSRVNLTCLATTNFGSEFDELFLNFEIQVNELPTTTTPAPTTPIGRTTMGPSTLSPQTAPPDDRGIPTPIDDEILIIIIISIVAGLLAITLAIVLIVFCCTKKVDKEVAERI